MRIVGLVFLILHTEFYNHRFLVPLYDFYPYVSLGGMSVRDTRRAAARGAVLLFLARRVRFLRPYLSGPQVSPSNLSLKLRLKPHDFVYNSNFKNHKTFATA